MAYHKLHAIVGRHGQELRNLMGVRRRDAYALQGPL